jgi:hypothetical protein
MYRDQICNRLSKPGEKLIKLVVLTRPKQYYKWVKNEETREYEEVEAGRGHETVRELSVSQEGKDIWLAWNADQRAAWLKNN